MISGRGGVGELTYSWRKPDEFEDGGLEEAPVRALIMPTFVLPKNSRGGSMREVQRGVAQRGGHLRRTLPTLLLAGDDTHPMKELIRIIFNQVGGVERLYEWV
jgi:hypothetical protein